MRGMIFSFLLGIPFWIAVFGFSGLISDDSGWIKPKDAVKILEAHKENERIRYIQLDSQLNGYIVMLNSIKADSLQITDERLLAILKGQ